MKEIREISEIEKWEYTPLIIPSSFADIFKDQIPAEKIQALKEGKCVFIEGFWTLLNKNLPTNSQ